EAADGSVIGEAVGAEEIAASYDTVRVYPDDGTPHTRHVISNQIVDIDDAAGTATCRYYITVVQRTDDFPLQPVWANRYTDQLESTRRPVAHRSSPRLQPPARRHLAPLDLYA